MIEINLLPEERRKKQSLFKGIDISNLNLENIPILRFIYMIFGSLLIIQFVLFLIGSYSRYNYTSLDKRYNEILPKKKESDALKAQIEVINKKVNAIDELMVNRFIWGKKLNELSDSMTSGVWLTELSYDEKAIERPVESTSKLLKNKPEGEQQAKPRMETIVSRYLILTGYATNSGNEGTASVGKFIQTLKDNAAFYSDFASIELGTIKGDKFDDQEVMNFKITCLFKGRK